LLHLQIDPGSGIPVYRQIMDQVRLLIAAGQLPAGGQLPSIRELARQLRLNPTTVVRAYAELAHQGDLEMVHGKGAFIAAARRPEPVEAEARFRVAAQPLARIALHMGLAADAAAALLRLEIERLRAGGGA
jgi:GntR family transcriptional regulator